MIMRSAESRSPPTTLSEQNSSQFGRFVPTLCRAQHRAPSIPQPSVQASLPQSTGLCLSLSAQTKMLRSAQLHSLPSAGSLSVLRKATHSAQPFQSRSDASSVSPSTQQTAPQSAALRLPLSAVPQSAPSQPVLIVPPQSVRLKTIPVVQVGTPRPTQSNVHRAAASGTSRPSQFRSCTRLQSGAKGSRPSHELSTPRLATQGDFVARLAKSQARSVRAQLVRIHHRKTAGERLLQQELARYNVPFPSFYPTTRPNTVPARYELDRSKQAAYSAYLRRSGTQLADFIRLLRGECDSDPAPNKALHVPVDDPSWISYRFASHWADIVRHGVTPRWHHAPPPQVCPPSNHGSARRALNALVKNIRKGQDEDRYLVLDIDLVHSLDGIFCSPFGAVPKDDRPLSEDARVIHDLSFPRGESINDFSVPLDEIDISYDGARAIASRIEEVEREFPGLSRMMSGDVSGAFRHIPLHADHCCKFAGTIPELGILVVDLCCPFGWRNSPASYAVAGGAINHLYSSSKPRWPGQPPCGASRFDGKVWCDDHNCVEPDIGTRLAEGAAALRAAMIHILGPSACNEDKFTAWFRHGTALGLEWDLHRRSLSIPALKIDKARHRIRALCAQSRATRTELNKVLGSLRHVATCVRSAAPFFQRLAAAQRRAPHFGAVPLSDGAKDDLRWFLAILAADELNAIPLSRFTCSQLPAIEIFMDASDEGLCALYPARREYLQVRFDAEELSSIQDLKAGRQSSMDINVRELMSAVYASLVWGPAWKTRPGDPDVHVLLRIDNTSAVAWNNRRSSRNPFAQMLLRLLALQEARHHFYVSAMHIPGAENVMADAGSRVWQSEVKAHAFTNLCAGWTQVTIPASSRKLLQVWERYSEQELWPDPQG